MVGHSNSSSNNNNNNSNHSNSKNATSSKNQIHSSSSSSPSSSSPCQPVSSSTMSSNNSKNCNNNVDGGGGGHHNHQNNQAAAAATSSNRCVWCRGTKQEIYVLPTATLGKKEFCSSKCLFDFRNAYKMATCSPCSNCECVVRQSMGEGSKFVLNGKEELFCTENCLNLYKKKHGLSVAKKTPSPPTPTTAASSSSTTSSSSSSTTTTTTPKSSLPPATKKKSLNDPNDTKVFSWSEYLTLTNSKPAHKTCFKQHLTPPANEFTSDMKLEAIDPRNVTSTCIATVIGCVGPRIRLRLDGSDNANDFWRTVDSHEIQPIGTCERSGGMLQPPLGFRMNASFWPMFLIKTLNGGAMSPEKCFKVEPPTPRFNLFKVGHKLEAVDRKNPHLICVATVGAVDRDSIHITFDGWRGAFDYWTKYDSRDIFPVGWCEQAGHPLQAPGNKMPLYGSLSSPQQISSNHHPENNPTSPNNSQQQQQSVPPYNLTLHLHPSCNCGPYLDPSRLRSSPTMIGPSNIQEVYNQFVQILRHCAMKGAPIDRLVITQPSEILEQGDFWTEVLALTERFQFCDFLVNDRPIDDEEDLGKTRSSARSKECPKCGGGGSSSSNNNSRTSANHHHNNNNASSSVGSSNGELSTTKTTPATAAGGGVKRKSTGSGAGTLAKSKVQEEVAAAAAVVLSPPLPNNTTTHHQRGQQAGPPPAKKAATTAATVTTNVTHQKVSQPPPPQSQLPPPPPTQITNKSQHQQPANNNGDPSDWDVEQVIRHITGVDATMHNYAELFRKHEIDGKAMLLLNSDMMMRYMGLKLGPALKICNIISKFKSKSSMKNGN